MREPLSLPCVAKRQAIAIVITASLLALAIGCGSPSSSSSSNSSHNSSSAATALWVANWGGNSVDAFSATQLAAGGNLAPAVDIRGVNTGFGEPACVTFDGNGNLWVLDFVGSLQTPINYVSQLEEFAASSLSAGGDLTPVVTVSGSNTALASGTGCQFDSKGNLWIANGSSVIAFSPAQLSSGGNIAPAIQIAGSNAGSCMGSLTFDKSGNLWVSDPCSPTVVEFRASDLLAGGNISPAVTITGTTPDQNFPAGLTFDSSGNLWVASNSTTVSEYKASDLSSGGSLVPAITIQCDQAAGVAFDANGNLWVSQTYGGFRCTAFGGCVADADALAMYSANTIAAGGNIVTPTVTVAGSGTHLLSPVSILFH